MIKRLFFHPHIYQIEVNLPDNPLRYLNAYVIKGETRNLIVDTGFNRPECRRDLFGALAELGIDLRRSDLFLTHLHADHTGLVGDFAAAGSTIYMHAVDYTYLQDSKDGSTWRFTEENFMREGMPEADIKLQFSNHARLYSPDPNFAARFVEDGDRLQLAGTEVQVIHTPGHTKGLCCLYLPQEKIFFTSDHILFDITPNIQVWSNMKDSLAQYLHSLDKVRNLPVRLVLPGHRKGRTSIVERIAELHDHHRRRLLEVEGILRRYGRLSAFAIAPHMTWSMRGKQWPAFPPTQKWFALGETLAHLEYLCSCQRISYTVENGVKQYALIADRSPRDEA